jgi:hypothetical protein
MKKSLKLEKQKSKSINNTKINITPLRAKNTQSNKEISKEEIIKDYLRLTNGNNRKISSMSAEYLENENSRINNFSPILGSISPFTNRQSLTNLKENLQTQMNGNSIEVNSELLKIRKNLSASLGQEKENKFFSNKNVINNTTENFFSEKLNTITHFSENKNQPSTIKIEDIIKSMNNQIIKLTQENKDLKNQLHNIQEEFLDYKKEKEIIILGTERERDEYKNMADKYLEVSRILGEEVIILRNQLDKFLYYKK